MDDFCWKIRHETKQVTSTKFTDVEDWIISEQNLPFYPFSKENAVELSSKSIEEIEKLLHDSGIVPPEKQKTRKEWLKEHKLKSK